MSNDLILNNKPAYLQTAQAAQVDNTAFEAAGTPLSKISIKGSKFRMDTPEGAQLVADQNGHPLPYIDVIMIAAATGVSKTYYKQTYQEGSDAAPDCSSANGVVPSPDVAADKRQHTSCAGCPKNAWGSDPKGAEQGKKLKACKDSKRLAIMFAYNEQFPIEQRVNAIISGPMFLLQIPGGSLQNLTACAKRANANKVAMTQMVIRISFDSTTAYPKLKFDFVRYLEEGEFVAASERAKTEEAGRITGDDEQAVVVADLEPAPAPEQVAAPAPEPAAVQMPAQPAQIAPVPTMPGMPEVAPAAQPAPTPQPAPAAFDPTQMAAIQPGAAAPIQGELIPATEPAAPVVPTSIEPTAEVDSAGAVWDASIHASTKTKNKDGTWKKKRGVGNAAQTASTPAPAASAAPAPALAPVAAPSADDDELNAALAALLPQ